MYRSPNIVRAIKSRSLRLAGHVARTEEGRSVLKLLTDKRTGKSTLERPRHIITYLKEIGTNTRNWVDSAQDRNS